MKNIELKNTEKRTRTRKGVAIELALTFLVLVFVLSTLLVGLAVIESKRIDIKSQELTKKAEIDCVGESFCCAVSENSVSSWCVDKTRYKSNVSQNGNVYTLTLFYAEDNETVLTVSLEKNTADNTCKITRWDYN